MSEYSFAYNPIQYNRDILLNVLLEHWRTPNSDCTCGKMKLGQSYTIHVADMYEREFGEHDG